MCYTSDCVGFVTEVRFFFRQTSPQLPHALGQLSSSPTADTCVCLSAICQDFEATATDCRMSRRQKLHQTDTVLVARPVDTGFPREKAQQDEKHIRVQHTYYTETLKASPYSITEHRVPELIPVLGSQPAGDVNHKPGGRLPLLSDRPAVTPATLKRAATNFAA